MKFAKKSLGQNFLIDKNIIKKITCSAEINNKHVIEIGPGKGALTNEILSKNPKSLYLVEKDEVFSNDLKKRYLYDKRVKVFNSDILKLNVEKICKNNSIIFGNLPYNISSQILVNFLKFKEWPPKYTNLIFMFQKELGEKIIGKFKTSNYGRLSILSNYRLEVNKKFFVSENCFFPKPKVKSMVIQFKPKNKILYKIKDIKNLEKVTNTLFSNRRKMINKNIKKIINKKFFLKLGPLNLKSRPSEISPETYYKITEIYENL